MNKHALASHPPRFNRRRIRRTGTAPDRRGSTIVVVIGLLGALLLLGIFVFTIATQEETNAEYFADASKVWSSELSREELFNWSLRQLIIGPDPKSEQQSALFGGRHSLVPTMFGRDLAPYSGQGVNLIWDPTTNRPAVDQDYDGTPDPNQTLLSMNVSPAAQWDPATMRPLNLNGYPEPDSGYTYPDLMSAFLSYRGRAPIDPATDVRVEYPSFHRPQYLRSPSGGNWYTDLSTATRVLRPHAEHRAVDSDGNVTAIRRFVSPTYPDNDPTAPLNPFGPDASTDGFAVINDGLWTGGLGAAGNVVYDVDTDGDGFRESIWLDLGFPIQERTTNAGTQTFVPLFGMRVVCADALFNVNAHGNIAFNANPNAPGFGLTPPDFISRSNDAQSPSEVSPLWALNTNPSSLTAADLEQYERYFGRQPANMTELANMDLWFLLKGRGQINATNTVDEYYPGRLGEPGRLKNATEDASGNVRTMKPVAEFPFPGTSLGDDNGNRIEGGRAPLAGLVRGPWFHPLDLYGTGRITVNGTGGKNRRLLRIGAHPHPQYGGVYAIHPHVVYGQPSITSLGALLSGFSKEQIDEYSETFLEPEHARDQLDDQIFGLEAASALQLTDADQTLVNLSSRVARLAPANFQTSAQAEQIRRRFTPVSWDVKALGKPAYRPFSPTPDARRRWEYTGDWDEANDGTPQPDGQRDFPPAFPNAQWPTPANPTAPETHPFRPELRKLLKVELKTDPTADPVRNSKSELVQRMLGLNHVLDRNSNGGLRLRPLTPHTGQDLDGNGTIDTPSVTNNRVRPYRTDRPFSSREYPRPGQWIADAADAAERLERQEFLARYDRQRLCRDIYVLLYTLGGGNDGLDYTADNSGGALYSFDPTDPRGDQCREMAQFAVNWVDAMDPDDTVTVFEYDVNLSDGWNLDDNPFTDASTSTDAREVGTGDRRVVCGTEAQQLAFNEALVLFAKRYVRMNNTPDDHGATEYNDEQNRDFTFMELENVGLRPVRFDHAGWQIVVRPDLSAATDPAIADHQPRALTLKGAQPPIRPGTNSRFTIRTAGDAQNFGDPPGSSTVASFFRVDADYPAVSDPSDPNRFERIAPKDTTSPGEHLDLITHPISRYDVHADPGNPINVDTGIPTGPFADGAVLPSQAASSGTPSGAELLHLQPTPGNEDAITDAEAGQVNDPVDPTDDSGIFVEMEIRRRVSVGRDAPVPGDEDQARDNPWVVVDRLRVPLTVFNINALEGISDPTQQNQRLLEELQKVRSIERGEPLRGHDARHFVLLPADPSQNTLGGPNRYTTGGPITQYSLYQSHVDRNHASVAELLNVPLYGPGDLTRNLPRHHRRGLENLYRQPVSALPARLAAHRFLHPLVDPAQPNLNNRWYRLFGFVEPQVRGEKENASDFDTYHVSQAVNPPKHYRTPGRLQLNTLSERFHLGGLLDAREIMGLGMTTDEGGGVNRHWWFKFLQARDGVDPITNAALPGLPTSRPFRPLSFAVQGPQSIEHTLLRSLPDNSGNPVPNGRRLFEIGTAGEHSGGNIDPTLRHRLLQKVANNSTNRSHIFFVFVQVDFFEAREIDLGGGRTVVRVGAKLDDSPGYRGFFVIDRSKALDLVTPSHLPVPYNDPVGGPKFNFAFNQAFPWQSLILHRQTIK